MLRVPSVYKDEVKINVTAKIEGCSYDSGCSGEITAEVTAYPFPYFDSKDVQFTYGENGGR